MSADDKALTTLPAAVQTRALAVDSEQASLMLPTFKAMWPEEYTKHPAVMLALAKVAIAYGLDPLMGELIILGGKLYVTFEGRLRKAMNHEQYAGMECRPASDEERAAFRCVETDHLWRAEVYRRDWRKPVIGWGRVTANDSNPIALKWPQAQAEKRAKARAFRDAFSIPLPSAEEADGYEPAPMGYVDRETGEIVDTPSSGTPITRGQLAAIHLISCGMELAPEDRHEALGRMFGKGHTAQLTEGEAATYLEFLGNLHDDREAAKPEVIEMKAREQAVYSPGSNGQSRRYATVPLAQSNRSYSEVFGAKLEEEGIQVVDVEAEAEGDEDTGLMPEALAEPVRAFNALHLPVGGEEVPWNENPKKRGGALKAVGDRLRLFDFSADEGTALFRLLHLAATGDEATDADTSLVSGRVLVALQLADNSELGALHDAARWIVAQGEPERPAEVGG